MIRVLVWNEFIHEKENEKVRQIYPKGIHNAIADFLRCDDIIVETATLSEGDSAVTKERLAQTDVLIWWGHCHHDDVSEKVACAVRDAVLEGMGLICLHSAHHSKPFRYLMGTSCNLCWRESGDSEILWVTDPSHPITRGINRFFRLPAEETYGEPFMIPDPDKILLLSSYSGGEVFRAGCLYQRGNGKVFYFQPGHEMFPTYYDKNVQTVIKNAVRFLAPAYRELIGGPHVNKPGEDGSTYLRNDCYGH